MTGLLEVYSRPEAVFTSGRGSTLMDDKGREYLDFASGIGVNALGYGSAELSGAIVSALSTGLIHTSNLYRTRPAEDLAEELVRLSFANRVFFCNSGAEANEAALKFARRAAGKSASGCSQKHEVVAVKDSFHGRLFGSLAITDRPELREPFEPVMPGVRFISAGDAVEAEAAISRERTAAVIVEPVQGEGGVNPLPASFLKALRQQASAAGAALIFDEVQCGLGRTGKLFAYETGGVVPDMVALAKPLAGGLPMGAVLLSESVAESIPVGDHATTFGGGPLVASVALTLVKTVAKPGFLAGVRERGRYLEELLGRLVDCPAVLAVRGVGLMWGVELAGSASRVVKEAFENRLLVTTAGKNVVRLLPPLTIREQELERGVDVLVQLMKRY